MNSGFNIDLNSATSVNGTLFFTASDGASGFELWKCDSSFGGMTLVKDINAGASGSYPASLTNVNGTLFFAANDDVNGNELWKSDGTTAGTVMVKDLYPGKLTFGSAQYPNSSSPSNFAIVAGKLYFTAYDGHQSALFTSDGRLQGTIEYSNVQPGLFVASGGALYFAANDNVHGSELWKFIVPVTSSTPQSSPHSSAAQPSSVSVKATPTQASALSSAARSSATAISSTLPPAKALTSAAVDRALSMTASLKTFSSATNLLDSGSSLDQLDKLFALNN